MLKSMIAALLIAVMASHPAAAVDAPSVLKPASEYTVSNKSGRLLVTVQIWGDLGLPGTYHVPDTTSLTTLISYAGGPGGELDDVTIKLRRQGEDYREINGEDLVLTAATDQIVMKSGDVVVVERSRTSESLLRNASLVSAITGAISSIALLVFLFRDQ